MTDTDSEFVPYGIALIPDNRTCVRALLVNRMLWSRQIDPPIILGMTDEMRMEVMNDGFLNATGLGQDLFPSVALPGTLPHITILQKMIRKQHLGDLVEMVSAALRKVSGEYKFVDEMAGSFVGYDMIQNYVIRRVVPHDHLLALHRAVLDANAAAKIDLDCRMPLPVSLDGNPPCVNMEPWHTHGYLHAGRNYDPHLTVARLRPELVDPLNATLGLSHFVRDPRNDWYAKRVVISRRGPNGTVPSDDIVLSLDGTVIKLPPP